MCFTVSSQGCEQLNICEHEHPAVSVTSKTTPCSWHHLSKKFYYVFKSATYVSKPLCTLFSDSLPRTQSQTHDIITAKQNGAVWHLLQSPHRLLQMSVDHDLTTTWVTVFYNVETLIMKKDTVQRWLIYY